MASTKDLKKRIVSVKNTQQTTKAMKMVSAAKLRRAQEAIQSQRPYAKGINNLLLGLGNSPELVEGSTYFKKSENTNEKLKVLLVLVTSDRGLCAGFNANIIKNAQRWVLANQNKYTQIQLAFVGRKAYDFFKTKKYDIGTNFVDFSGKVTFAKAKGLAKQLVGKFEKGEFDEIKIIYNEFKNAISQQVNTDNFLPLDPTKMSTSDSGSSLGPKLIIKPDAKTLFNKILENNFNTQCFRVLLDSQAGEHGARMSAMENATKNASEMIKKLTLIYNKQRQANITKELLEIISGSESQKTA